MLFVCTLLDDTSSPPSASHQLNLSLSLFVARSLHLSFCVMLQAKDHARSSASSSGSGGSGGGGGDPGAAALQAKAEMMLRKMQGGESGGAGGGGREKSGGPPGLTVSSAAMAKLGKGTIDRKQARIIQEKLREERERKQKQLESANKPSTQDMLKQLQQRKAESDARNLTRSAPASNKLQESSQLMAKLKEDRQAGVRSEIPSTLVSKLTVEERRARRRSRRSSQSKIRSLADLQNAIKRADDRKKTAKREVLQSTISRKKVCVCGLLVCVYVCMCVCVCVCVYNNSMCVGVCMRERERECVCV
jgi:hypothetical protein